ncbi:cadherin-related family member 5 isoform X3 [Mesocricetus auratus]|uniref:Cadherin-related family member 5 isoform X3 n=1 Tax=Mesocricetus auratus TaxID=10036 RepID=A0ABM2XXS5_MESAU|nr:cadherin-related family member 5 isoform X3 [Mesocricetus auratus]
MGAPALLWPPLLLPLLVVLVGQPPGTSAQSQVCSVDLNSTSIEIEENTNVSEPLANISVPDGMSVTLGSSSTPLAFKIVDDQLFLIVIPDYEENPVLEAVLECKRDQSVVTQLRVFVIVQDVNDNAPEFPFTIKTYDVAEDTKVGTIVIPGTELEAKDADKDDTLFYTLQEVTPNTTDFFTLVGQNNPALRLQKSLDFYKNQNMTFKLLARDTWDEAENSSHTATATVILNVLPADLRTPWFLPCSFSDGHFCIQAQYHGVVPTGHTLPSPLTLTPGPIYAVDGDQGINQPIIYSIVAGNTDDTFIISTDSGNLTMAKSIPRPMTFTLLVRADQADMARYSMTQAIVEARDATGSPLQFSRSRYHGTVVLGSKAGTEVKDRTSPSEILRIQAQYLDFPDLNSAITYGITNSSDFKMDEDVILTTVDMEHVDTFYVEVEATNTVTKDTATTVVEIQVSEQEPTTGTQTPKPGTSQPTVPITGTSQPAVPITGTSTTSQPATPSGGSTQTPKPGTSQPTTTAPTRSPSPSGTQGEGQRFSTVDMAVLGGVLGALLLLALICLVILIHKHYRHRFKCCSGKVKKPPLPLSVYDNLTFFPDHKASWSSTSSPQPQRDPETAQSPSGPHSPMSSSPTPPSSPPPSPKLRAPESPKTVQAGDSPLAVRSILTKERRPEGEGGYKAVWFGKDIREEADVVVLNEPAADVDSASATGSEGSDDDDPHQSYI